MAELADAPGLGPGARKGVGVQVPPSALNVSLGGRHQFFSTIGPALLACLAEVAHPRVLALELLEPGHTPAEASLNAGGGLTAEPQEPGHSPGAETPATADSVNV